MSKEARSQSDLASLFQEVHDTIAASRELLRGRMPDTFLGRRTQEPFPREKQPV